MAKRGKKYQEALKLVDRSKRYNLAEAVELVKKTNTAPPSGRRQDLPR